MHVIKNNPKALFIVFLLIFYITTSLRLPINLSLYLFVACVGFSLCADLLFAFFRRRQFFIPYSAVITGLIIALIVDFSAPWYQILVICVVAMGIKNFLRISGRHIFNPAATGLIMGWILFGLYPSWWAASLYTSETHAIANILFMISLLTLAFVPCYKYKKYPAIISFLLSFGVLSLLPSSLSIKSSIAMLVNPGILFYTIVMVAEPMTSPVNKKRQILYGFFVALISSLLVLVVQKNIFPNNLPDSLLIALLLGNLLFFKFR